MSTLSVRRIGVAVEGGALAGLLVLHHEALVAVLVRLNNAIYGTENGRWYLEAGFGRCAVSKSTFETLNAALLWVATRLSLPDEAVAAAIEGFSTSS